MMINIACIKEVQNDSKKTLIIYNMYVELFDMPFVGKGLYATNCTDVQKFILLEKRTY